MVKSEFDVKKLFTSKYSMIFVTWITMTLVIFLQRKAFVAHVFCVTYQLLVVLYQINSLYGRIKNKNELFYLFVVAGGTIHAFVPVFGIFYPVAMYGHVAFCFLVHILHLTDCYLVFNDMQVHDTKYIIILVTVNILEFGANFAYMFPSIVSDAHMVPILVCVEVMALLISILKVRKRELSKKRVKQIKVSPESESEFKSKADSQYSQVDSEYGNSQYGHSQAESEYNAPTDTDVKTALPTENAVDLEAPRDKEPAPINNNKKKKKSDPADKIKHQKWMLDLSTSRFFMLGVAESAAIVSLLFPSFQYSVFTIASGVFLSVAVMKCDVNSENVPDLHVVVKMAAIVLISMTFAALYVTHILPALALVIVNMVVTVIVTLNIFINLRKLAVPKLTYMQYAVLSLLFVGTHITEAVMLPDKTSTICGVMVCASVACAMIIGILKLK